MRLLLLAVVAVALAWGAGLLAFAGRVIDSTPAPRPPVSDGVVALTGGSSLRISAAAQLLEDGLAGRLLISGVNPESTRAEVRRSIGAASEDFDCCVDLGFEAENTVGNARETADWAHYHHYRSLIVVTADYHMPRALLELHAAMPRVALHPYPVATQTLDVRRWWASREPARRMVTEYSKYLAVLTRDTLQGLKARALGPRSSPAADPANAGA